MRKNKDIQNTSSFFFFLISIDIQQTLANFAPSGCNGAYSKFLYSFLSSRFWVVLGYVAPGNSHEGIIIIPLYKSGNRHREVT